MNNPLYTRFVKTIFISLFFFSNIFLFAQNIKKDTILASAYFKYGDDFYYKDCIDSSTTYYLKAAEIYENIATKNKMSSLWVNHLDAIYYATWNLTSINSLEESYKLLSIAIKKAYLHLGSKHEITAKLLSGIGKIHERDLKFKDALKYYYECLDIYYFNKNKLQIATTYDDIGNILYYKQELNLSIEFHLFAIQIYKEIGMEKSEQISDSYINISTVYITNGDYKNALLYANKSLVIRKNIFNLESLNLAIVYENIGSIYFFSKKYDLALENFFHSKQILQKIPNENKKFLNTISLYLLKTYREMDNYKEAFKFGFKALNEISNNCGLNVSKIAIIYSSIAKLYRNQNQLNLSLAYYQKAITSNLKNFNDTTNIKSVPIIKDYLNWDELLKALQAKAQIFAKHYSEIKMNKNQALELALRHYQACDTLISDARQHILSKADKISLGNKATGIYKEAIGVCLDLYDSSRDVAVQRLYTETAFQFSEKSRAGVLTEAIAGIDLDTGMVRDTKYDISRYKTKLAEETNDSLKSIYSQRLLNAYAVLHENERKDNKIVHNVSVKDIQQQLNNSTTLIEYLVSDSILYIFKISQQGLKIKSIPLNASLDKLTHNYYMSIIDKEKSDFIKYSSQLYNILIKPLDLDKNTKQLIIIPDGKLGIIPFEPLISSIPKNKNSKHVFANMDYLIKNYRITYHYSASLWMKSLEMSREKDNIATSILACAPITFERGSNVYQMPEIASNTKAGWQPLPETGVEVDNIISLFNKNNVFKTKSLKNAYANEINLKADAPNYKFIHLTTHGVADSIRPERSRVLLSQPIKDSTNLDEEIPSRYKEDDGFLYAGEMFFMNLKNCDLFVLSACETGVGKVMKGEGTMAMHRGLMYAGAPNIIYSLWEIPETLSKDLMIDFYTHFKFTDKNKQLNYSEYLQKAKLKMIKNDIMLAFWAGLVLLGR